MKPNINDPSKFSTLEKTLIDRGISKTTIATLKKALELGFVVKSAADIKVLDIPAADADIVIGESSIGPRGSATPAAFKTFKFVPKGPDNAPSLFFGYQFVLGYTDNANNTIEESYPIDDTHNVVTDISKGHILDGTQVSFRVKTPQGTYAQIGLEDAPLEEDKILVPEQQFDAKTIFVAVEGISEPTLDPVTSSYQVSGRLISKDTDVSTEQYQVIIFASTSDITDSEPEFFPVAYAVTENNGYFLTGFLAFQNVDDITRVRRARAFVTKDDFQVELEIKTVVTQRQGFDGEILEDSMIPHRLILVIDRNVPHTADDDCGCGCQDLNFHEKKVFEEFSYHTVVRTTEPSVIADVIEEEEEIDLSDIYGEPARGIRVPISVFRKFHDIKSRQSSFLTNLTSSSSPLSNVTGGISNIAMSLDASAASTSAASRKSAIFGAIDINLLDKLTVDARAEQIANPVLKQRVHKGRAHLTPLNQINWDKPTVFQAASIAHGHLLQFKQEWMPDGYSIGDLLYSLPLAPGQKKQIAVLDWERRESAANSQALDYEESLNNSLIRDRDISEIVSATLSENLRGSSTARTSGFGAGFGAGAMGMIGGMAFGSLLGISGGSSKSSSVASQDSSRSSTANSLQSIRDRTLQAASAVRSQRSTVIQTVSQGERVQATSESIANYNHCHAITIQYFEVLRHFAIHNRFVGAQECLFIPLQIVNFDIKKVLRWRNALERRLLVPRLRGAFEALERIQNEQESASENYYDSIGYPVRYFAEQQILSFQGEIYMEFYFFNTKDSIDDALIGFFKKFFRIDLNEYKDRKLTDAELSQVVGPRTIEHLLDAMVIETDTGQSLNVDITLVTPFRQNARLQVSLRQAGPVSIAREAIDGIRIRLDESKVKADDNTDIKQFSDKYMKILVRSGSLRYRTKNFASTLFNTRIDNDLFVGVDSVFIPTPLNNDELRNPRGEDVDAANNLIHHLNENLEYYHCCLWFDMTAERRYMLLDGIVAPGKANGRSVASVVENRIIGIAGNSLIMPVAPGNQLDPTIDDQMDLFARYHTEDTEPMHVSLPTKGVYAEAVIGKCNSCEEKDEGRFWRWEESPIPDSPNTQINPLNTDTRRTDPGVEANEFANPMINIQNAPSLPDPTGLQNLTTLLGRSDLFRDVTGLTENQRNALATFQKSMDTAQAFGKEAADLAKTAGMIDLIKNAKKDGTLSNDQAKEKAAKAIDDGAKDPDIKKLDEGLKMLDDYQKAGIIPADIAAKAKEALVTNHIDRVGSDTPMSPSEINNMADNAAQNNAGISVIRPDGEKVEITPNSSGVGSTNPSTTVDLSARGVSIIGKETIETESKTRPTNNPGIKETVELIKFYEIKFQIKNDNFEPFEVEITPTVEGSLPDGRTGTHTAIGKILASPRFTSILNLEIARSRFADGEVLVGISHPNSIRRGDTTARITPANTLYLLPFPKNVEMRCSQSFTDTNPPTAHELHTGDNKFAVDFAMPIVDPAVIPDIDICASRSGTVVEVHDGDDDHPGNFSPTAADLPKGNEVRIIHSDNTYTQYAHLKKGSIAVIVGQRVIAGVTHLGKMGNSGFSSNYHLHFSAQKIKRGFDQATQRDIDTFETLEFKFKANDGTGFQPTEGALFKRTIS